MYAPADSVLGTGGWLLNKIVSVGLAGNWHFQPAQADL
jgi:hypothetical protein